MVVGTDTGVGKTLVSAGLTRSLALREKRVCALKPVVSGSVPAFRAADASMAPCGPPLWEDLEFLTMAGGVPLSAAERAIYRFHAPAAPSLAATLEGRKVDRRILLAGIQQVMGLAEFSVVEGVGGFRVPLGEGFDTADLAVWLGLPVVLVVALRLGCISHAMLTMEAITARGLRLSGWVANGGIDSSYAWTDETIGVLEEGLGVNCSARFGGLVQSGAQSPRGPVGSPEWRAAVESQVAAASDLLGGLARALLA
jgi:dethiobiotin synthetase